VRVCICVLDEELDLVFDCLLVFVLHGETHILKSECSNLYNSLDVLASMS
jgi:hypothetical protein